MKSAVRHCAGLTVGLPFVVGLLLGLAMSAALSSANGDLAALCESAAATTLFMAACGTAGYATARDLSGVARARSWAALLGISILGVVLIFVNLPGGVLVCAILGLVIFAGLTMADFRRLRRSTDLNSAALLAASIFLDALNVFLIFFQCFGRREDWGRELSPRPTQFAGSR
jgi:FtsH-binding integral membrane protein